MVESSLVSPLARNSENLSLNQVEVLDRRKNKEANFLLTFYCYFQAWEVLAAYYQSLNNNNEKNGV